MKADHLIHAPHRQARTERTLYGVATLLVWAVYAWLWLPLATLVLWFLGLRLSYLELYLAQQRIDPTLLVVLPLLLLACAAVLVGWAEYNRWRFGRRERRLPRVDVSPDEVASALRAPPELAARLSQARSAVLVMDADGRPVMLQTGPLRASAAPVAANIAAAEPALS